MSRSSYFSIGADKVISGSLSATLTLKESKPILLIKSGDWFQVVFGEGKFHLDAYDKGFYNPHVEKILNI